MRCPKCKKQLREGAKFCPACGARVKKRQGRRVVAVLLAILLLLGVIAGGLAIGIFAAKHFGNSKSAPKISNVEEAIAHAKELGEELGYENAMSEMTEKVTTEIEGDCYYRLQQNYQGIPVYGRTIIYATSQGGRISSITGNILDVDEDVDITPTVTQEMVNESIHKYFYGNQADISVLPVSNIRDDNLCFYCANGKTYLSYVIYSGSDEFVIDAHDATVLLCSAELVSDAITYTSTNTDKDMSGSVSGPDKINDSYILKDVKRNIYIYDAGKKTFWDPRQGDITHPEVLSLVCSKDTVFGNNDDNAQSSATAFTYLQLLSSAYDFFHKINPCINDNDVLVGIYDDYMNNYDENSKNAGGGYELFSHILDGPLPDNSKIGANDGDKIGAVIIGAGYSDSLKSIIDTIGHEYTHVISFKEVDWKYSIKDGCNLEAGAINEGLSDIFGELVEASVTDKPATGSINWIHGDRVMSNPSKNGYPERSGEKALLEGNYVSVRDTNGDDRTTDYSHAYSTVISHAAYLMWHGINNDASKKIDTEKLAKLWYRAMLMMPSDCDFIECRTLVELAASTMNLSDLQKQCVCEAFDTVGIPRASEEERSQLVHFVANGKTSIKGTIYEVKTMDGIETVVPVPKATMTVYSDSSTKVYEKQNMNDENGFFEIELHAGTYSVAITAEGYIGQTISFELFDNEVRYFSVELKPSNNNLGNNSDAYNAYLNAAQKTTESGSWSERLDLTANMAITDGSTKTKTKMTMTSDADISNYSESDPSKVRMSGAAEMSVMGQTYAWNMQYENGTAHYQYTKPNQTSADLAIDPGFFNFGTMTSEMMTNAKMSGNQITFTVPGDKITKVGIAAVNQLSGVDDLNYGDVDVAVTISNEGTIDTITMVFHASLKYQGYDADVDYDIRYRFSKSTAKATSGNISIQPGYYVQDGNELNTLTVHAVSGNSITFSVWWYRIWDISNAKATGSGNTVTFDYTAANNASLSASGSIAFSEDTATLTLTDCTNPYVDTGDYRFKLIGRIFTEEQLAEIKAALGVPENLDVEISQGEPVYWEGGGFYRTYIEIHHNGEMVASANVHSLTGALAGSIYMYSGSESTPELYASGNCGDALFWSLTTDGTLTISGNGDMYGYPLGDSSVPWLNGQVPVTSVVFSGNITSIGEYAFCKTSIKNISIPASVTVIGYAALDYIDTLEGIWVDGGNPVYSSDDSGVLFDKEKTTLIAAPTKLKGTYTVPTTVTWIYDTAFSNCSEITKINWPDSVSRIGQGAFSGCSGLEYICIPGSVTAIEPYTFYACSSMTGIRIPEGITSIGWEAFGECPLKEVFYGGTNQQWQQMMGNCLDETISGANVYELSY